MNTRRIACRVIDDVLSGGAYMNLALKESLRGLSAEDRRFTTALVMTTLENLLRIDYMIRCKTSGQRIHREVRNALRVGVCQLMFFENVPVSAAVNESVAALPAKDKRQRGFVNAVLRRIADEPGSIEYPDPAKEPVKYLSVMYSYPEWICEKYIRDYGFDFAEQLLAYKKQEAYTCVRANGLKAAEGEVCSALGAFDTKRGRFVEDAIYVKNIESIEDMALFRDGKLAVQSEAAMLCVRASGVGAGTASLLDACAAPGGKSAYAAGLAPGIAITAIESRAGRAELMAENFGRLGVKADIIVADARESRPELRDRFDVVIVDAPCTALGLMYRKPDIRYSRKPGDVEALCSIQRDILAACADYTAPGGTLLYSTCTIDVDENERRIEAFLRTRPDYERGQLTDHLPPLLCPRVKGGTLQLFPHIDGVDGFFMASLRRKGS